MRDQTGYDGKAFLDIRFAFFTIGRYSGDTLCCQHAGGVPQYFDRLEQIVSHYRHGHIELKIPALCSQHDRGVISDNLHSHLKDRFGDHRVDLAGHYGGARL